MTQATSTEYRGSTGVPNGRGETVAGAILLAWSFVAAVLVARSPGPNGLDRWGFSLLEESRRNGLMIRITELGDLPVLIVGSVAAALLVVGRDRSRALVCLVAPAVATVLVEWMLKPWVGRHYLGVLSYPSGSVTVVASLGTALVIAVPGWVRWPVAAAAALVTVLMGVAVVVLRWHEPSDALAGAVFGVGVVLLLDGLVHLDWLRRTFAPR